MLKTAITELLGLEYPIFQGAMAWVSSAKLAAAVSQAGGLGILAGANHSIDFMQEQIRQVKAATSRPFAVNIMLMSPNAAALADLVIAEQVPVVTTGAGNPSPYMAAWLAAGVKVIPVVPAAALAKRMAGMGASAVIAEGTESGGHIGELTTMALLPQVVQAVDIPVIAAGGIANGATLAAALMLGAAGAQCGTCFLVANECEIHANYKKMIIKAKDTGTVVTGRHVGLPVRVLKNPMANKYLQMEKQGENTDPLALEALTAGSLKKAVIDGDEAGGSFMAGQIAGLISCEDSCQAIISEMAKDAEAVIRNAQKFLV